MGGSENAEKVRRYFDVWQAEGAEAFFGVVPEDVEWHPYPALGRRKIWGTEELRVAWAKLRSRGIIVEGDVDTIEPIDDDNVIVIGTIHQRTGDEVSSQPVAWLYSFRDGVLWRASGHPSAAEAREAARFLHSNRVALGRADANFAVTLHEEPHGRSVIELAGELDVGTADEATAAIDRAARSGHVLVDLRGLEFMDSSGLRVLLEATRRAQENGWRLELRRGSDVVQRVIRLAGAERLLPFESA